MTLLKFAFWLAVAAILLALIPMPGALRSAMLVLIVIAWLLIYFFRRGM